MQKSTMTAGHAGCTQDAIQPTAVGACAADDAASQATVDWRCCDSDFGARYN